MSITKKEAYFTSSNGFTGIHCCIWQSKEKQPKALFQIAHGLGENINKYDELASFLAEHSYVVFGNDHLGHGDSVFEDEYGYFGALDGDKRLVDDMHILTIIMKKRYPGLPLILMGHGLGSMCARVYAADFSEEANAVILSGTTELPSALVTLEAPIKFLCDKLGDIMIINENIIDRLLSFANKKDAINSYIGEDLYNKTLTLGGARDILSLVNTACATTWINKLNPMLKMFIISGANDPLSINGRTLMALSDNLEDTTIKPEIRMFPCMNHDIFASSEAITIYAEILAFADGI